MKQASRNWYKRLTSLLIQHDYQQVDSYHSLSVKRATSSITVFLLYVDDNISMEVACVFSTNNQAKNALHTAFQIKCLGILKYFLDLEFVRSKKGIS